MKLYLVIKNVEGRDVGVNKDQTTESNLNRAELMTRAEADALAEVVKGTVVSEQRAFPQDWD